MNEQQKIEELLKPRYEVIAPYPAYRGHGIEVGDILTDPGDNECVRNQKGQAVVAFHWDMFPHLFKPLQWWEKRSVEEMPEYVKNEEGEVFKIKEWDGTSVPYVFVNPKIHSGYVESATYSPLYPPYFPATESEYTAYINSKK